MNIKEKLEDIWWEIDYHYKKIIRNPYYNVKYGLKNIIKWFPVIWNDRNWDHAYILILLNKKFELMQKTFEKHSNSINADKSIQQLMICKNLCKRLVENNYDEHYFAILDRMYGEIENHATPTDNPNIFKCDLRREKETEISRRLTLKFMKNHDKIHRDEFDLLMNLMKKHFFKWWY